LDKFLVQAGLTVLGPAKAKILAAVLEYALANGFVFRSLREIARGSGVSHRMLLYHFGSQDNLWNAVLNYVRQVELRRAEEQHRNCRNTEELRASLRARWALYSGDDYLRFFRFFFEVYGYALSQPEKFDTFLSSVIGPWLAGASELFKQVGYPELVAANRSRVLIAGFRGLFLDILTTGEHDQVNAAANELIELLCSPATAPHRGDDLGAQ
jgi:AcrR family transcriptional regulator